MLLTVYTLFWQLTLRLMLEADIPTKPLKWRNMAWMNWWSLCLSYVRKLKISQPPLKHWKIRLLTDLMKGVQWVTTKLLILGQWKHGLLCWRRPKCHRSGANRRLRIEPSFERSEHRWWQWGGFGWSSSHITGDDHMRQLATYLNRSRHDFPASILSQAENLFASIREHRSRRKRTRQ